MAPTATRFRLALLAIAALMLAACGGTSAPDLAGTTTPPAGTPLSLPSTATELPDADPGSFRALLASLQGKPVLVNIWASWCAPCTLEAPVLAAKAREYEGRVQFLGVDILDNRAPAREFIKHFGWSYPSVFDPSGSIRDDLGLIGQPHTIIYDEAGKQAFVWSGAISEEQLDEALRDVVST